MDRVDKSGDDEKSNFLGSFIWFVLMGRSHYVLIGMLGMDVDRTYFLYILSLLYRKDNNSEPWNATQKEGGLNLWLIVPHLLFLPDTLKNGLVWLSHVLALSRTY